MRRLAILPALNEAPSIASVIAEIRAADPEFEMLVVDDGSTDGTARVAANAGARVLRLPYNLGIGAAVQSGYRYAFDHGFDIAVQVDADGQHDPGDLAALLAPILAGDADLVLGSRFVGDARYSATVTRRLAMRVFAAIVSFVVRKRLTDTTSAFRATNRRGIAAFAATYPDGFMETVEATVIAARQGLRLREVPVAMRQRRSGRSSLTTARSLYYAASVLVAIFARSFQRETARL